MAINNNEALYQVLIGVDEAGSSTMINSQLKALAKTLNIDIAPRITANNRSAIIKQLSDAVKQATSKIDFDFSKLEKYVPPEFTIRFNSDAIKASMDKLVGGLGKEFFKAGELNAIVEELQKATNAGFELSKAFRNVDGDLKIMGTTTDEYGNKMGRVLKLTKDGFESVGTSFVSGQTKDIESKIAEIGRVENELNKLITLTASGSNKVTNETSGQITSLRTEIENNYKGLEAFVNNAANLTEAHKAELLGYIQDLRTARVQNEAQAEAKGKEANSYIVATQALKEYGKEARLLTKVQLGAATGVDEGALKERLKDLRAVAQEYPNITAAMSRFDQAEEQAFNDGLLKNQQIEAQNLAKEYDQLNNKLKVAARNFKDSSFKGDVFNADIASSTIDELLGKLKTMTTRINELEQANIISPEEANRLRQAAEEMADLGDTTKIVSINAKELDDRLGKIIENRPGLGELDKTLDANSDATKEYIKALTGLEAIEISRKTTNTNLKRIDDILVISYKDQTGAVRELTLSHDKLDDGYRTTANAAGNAKKGVQSFTDRIVDATKKIAMWGLSTKIVYGVWNSFKEGIKVIEELDKELTQISVVSGKSREGLKSHASEFADTAVRLNQTVVEVAKLNTELVRQGLSLEESAARTETIMKLSAAGAITMEQSLAVITSGVNALGETHEKIADVLLKAANITASDVEGLGEAFTKTASGAKAAGLSIEQTTSLLATMKDVTQEGDSQLGTSLKSILARFSKIDKETGEVNEAFNETQKAIESVGVAFLDTDGQIRNTYEILEDLSVKWEDLDRNTQAYIATQAAGTRQQNRFYAIMDNFNKVQAVHNDLLNSAGTLQEAYGVYLGSSEAATKKLKASLQRLWINFINSDVLIWLKQVATAIIDIVDKIGPLEIGIMAITTRLLFLKNGFMSAFLGPMKTYFSQLSASIAGTTAATGAATGATITLGTAIKSALIGTGVGALIVFGTAVATYIIKKFAEAKVEAAKKMDEMKQDAQEVHDYFNSRSLRIADLQDSGETYIELQEKVDNLGGTFALTEEEAKLYYEAQAKIVELLPTATHYTDEYGRIILTSVGSVEQLTKAEKELAREMAKTNFAKSSAVAREAIDTNKELTEAREKEAEALKISNELLQAKYAEENALARLRAELGRAPEDDTDYINDIKERILAQEQVLYAADRKWSDYVTATSVASVEAAKKAVVNLAPVVRDFINSQNLEEIPAHVNEILMSKPILLALEKVPIDEWSHYLEVRLADLTAKEHPIKIGVDKLTYSQVAEKITNLTTQLSNGTILPEAFLAEIEKLKQGINTIPDKPLKDAFLGQISDAKLRAEGLGVSIEDLDPALQKVATRLESSRVAFTNQTMSSDSYVRSLQAAKAELLAMPKGIPGAETMIADLNRLIEAQEASNQKFSEAQGVFSQNKKELEELAWFQWQVNEGGMKQNEINDYLLANHPLWVAQANDKKALNGLIENSIIDLKNTQIQSYIDMMVGSEQMSIQQAANYRSLFNYLAEAYGFDLKNFANLAEVKDAIDRKLLQVLGANWQKFYQYTDGQLQIRQDAINAMVNEASKKMPGEDEHAWRARTSYALNSVSDVIKGMKAKVAAFNSDPNNLLMFSAKEFLNSADFDKIANFVATSNKSSANALRKLIKEKKDAEAKAAEAKAKAAEAARKKGEAAAKAAAKASEAEKKAREKAAKAEAKVAKAAQEALGATKEELSLRQEIADLNAKENAAKNAEEVFNVAKEFLEWQKQILVDKITEGLNAEKDGLLKALELEEQKLQNAKEYNNYLKERKALQDSIANLEYRSAIASFDSSVGGKAKQRELNKELAEARESLSKTEDDRIQAVQNEEFARRKAKIETLYAEWLRLAEAASKEELNDAEILKLTEMANAGSVTAAELLEVQQRFNDKQIYLDALKTVQTGMIQTLTGDFIPLEEAYKRLNIQNGKFWTFFGQKDVDDFKTKVNGAIQAVKTYGLTALQQWKDLSVEIKNAEDKLQDYLDSIKNADTTVPAPKTSSTGTTSSAGKSSGSTSGSTASKTATPSKAPTSGGSPVPAALTPATIKKIQIQINKAEAADKTGYIRKVVEDGVFGWATINQLRNVYDKYLGSGDPRSGIVSLAQLNYLIDNKRQSEGYKKFIGISTFPEIKVPAKTNTSDSTTRASTTSTSSRPSAYAEGGKIDYTGPAAVHGSKSKPEYVFNYPQFKDLAKMIAQHQFTAGRPAIANTIPPKIDIQIGNLINVEGNITKDVVPKVEQITQHAMTELKRTIQGWGK